MKLWVEYLEGTIRVDRIAAFAERLLSMVQKHSQIQLNFTKLEEIDLSFVHLLYAARRFCAQNAKELRFIGSIAPAVAEKLRAGGFVDSLVVDASELDVKLVGADGEGADG